MPRDHITADQRLRPPAGRAHVPDRRSRRMSRSLMGDWYSREHERDGRRFHRQAHRRFPRFVGRELTWRRDAVPGGRIPATCSWRAVPSALSPFVREAVPVVLNAADSFASGCRRHHTFRRHRIMVQIQHVVLHIDLNPQRFVPNISRRSQ
jgi:hypothetical protein